MDLYLLAIVTGLRRCRPSHVLWPAVVFAAAFAAIAAFDLDRRIAQVLFHDAASGLWLGGSSGSWWARDLLHTGGRWLVRSVAAAALIVWCTALLLPRLRHWRRRAAFAFLALVLSTGIVGGLKAVTNVDCPWDLAGFGGNRPHIGLFADRPDALPHAQCFPGAHAASGFALLFGYFLFRDSSRRRARWALTAGILTGLVFSLGQQARGAHFLSHDLASAAIVWYVQLLLYRLMLAPRAAAVTADSAVQYPAGPRLSPNQDLSPNPSPTSGSSSSPGSSSSTGPGAGRRRSTEVPARLRPRRRCSSNAPVSRPPMA